MNPEFERFRKFIENLGRYEGTKFDSPEGEELKRACYDHAENNTSGQIGDNNIIAVHLYHHELAWGRWYDESTAKEKRPAQVKILEELLRKANGDRFKKVIIESHIQYAQRSHQLVDEGVIDSVIFTANGWGVPLDNSNLEPFSRSKTNYVGGVYGYQCVNGAIDAIRGYAPFYSIRPIRDAIIFDEPDFLLKLSAMTSCGTMIIEGHEDLSFHIDDKIYSLFRGVKSDRLLQ